MVKTDPLVTTCLEMPKDEEEDTATDSRPRAPVQIAI